MVLKHIKIVDSKKSVLADNLTENCVQCLASCDFEGRTIPICPEYGDKRRQGQRITNSSTVFLCCAQTKTTKLFKQKIEALSYCVPELKIPISEIRNEEQKKVNRLVHNLTSINAHNIQEVYDLVPQEILAQNWRKQLDFIKEEIEKDMDKAALMFLRIAKHNTHMRSEFSIYRKLERDDNIELDKKEHNLRNVLLNTLHTFFSDFSKQNVYVEVDDFFFKVSFDYETIQVALYHLIENAAKYTLYNTKVSITAFESDEWINLKFDMTSIHVTEDEKEEIMKEGVSGKMAKKMQKQGDGIGMWRIDQMLKINDGEFEAIFGGVSESKMGFDFSNNIFIMKFLKD
ncbi:ATP-binding protein [Allomuricauda taeanensis]|uniref:ATP-binding protein n=1 Tax=Flagellimonas taeanensis TaxID=1005926 RepID=UPI002E7B98F0|nr:ATP-binding protein [Allomuricauda taeanensis]MEE1961073.1 ATP-binding protein [Allomuricauda taeanensis]